MVNLLFSLQANVVEDVAGVHGKYHGVLGLCHRVCEHRLRLWGCSRCRVDLSWALRWSKASTGRSHLQTVSDIGNLDGLRFCRGRDQETPLVGNRLGRIRDLWSWSNLRGLYHSGCHRQCQYPHSICRLPHGPNLGRSHLRPVLRGRDLFHVLQHGLQGGFQRLPLMLRQHAETRWERAGEGKDRLCFAIR